MPDAVVTPSQARPARYVGQRIQRVEDPRLLTGRGQYLDDIHLPGMLHASFVRSPHPHARIRGIDASRALELEGVVAVYTGADLRDHLADMVTRLEGEPGLQRTTRFPLAIDKVRHVGDPVAIVVATSPYIAEDGRDLVDIDWEPLPVVVDPERALEEGAPLLDESLTSNQLAHITGAGGDPEKAFAEATHVFSKRFHVGRSTGAPVEPRGIVASFDSASGRVKIWASSQSPHLMRTELAPVIKMPEGKITIVAPDVGGGFGLKCHIFPEDSAVPAASKLLNRPVKWIEDRWENLATGIHSKSMVAYVDLAVDEDGRFTGIRARFVSDAGAYSSFPFSPLVDGVLAGTMLMSLYDIDHVGYVVDVALTNKCQLGAIRGVGWTPGQLGRETLIDDVARELDIDPVEIRLRNVIGPEPRRTTLGQEYDGGSYGKAIELARDTIGYDEFRERQRALREEGRYVGVGFSAFVEPTGLSSRSALALGLPIAFFDSASVTMEPDGSVTVTTGMHSHGQGQETTFAQVAADELGVPIENVRIVFGDTDSSVYGAGTYASRSAVIATGSIMSAAGQIRDRLKRLAAEKLEASAEDIELRDGQANVVGVPSRAVSIAELADMGYFGMDARPADVKESGLAVTAAYDPPQTYANGTEAVTVEVDVDTGRVTIDRLVAVEDCGIMLNPMIVEGQIAGAAANGIGIALFEDLVYGEDGEFLSGSLLHYLYPSTSEVPIMEIRHIETPSPVTAGGVKGSGEAGTIATPAAIVNAIADALSPFGVRIERTPVTPVYIRELLRNAGHGAGARAGRLAI